MRLDQLRRVFRRLWKSRGFSACVISTLGLGIGATVAVFSIIYAVLIQPLPYANPASLVSVYQSKTANDLASVDGFSPANFLDFRQQNGSLTDLGGYCGFPYVLTTHGRPEAMEGAAVSSNFFDILGIHPAMGRNFLAAEDSYSSEHVVILSHHVWAEKFQSDPHTVGHAILLNGESFYVVGVMPADFRFLNEGPTDLWIPLQQQVRPDRMLWRDQHFLTVIGRLRHGVTIDQARADMNRIAVQVHAAYPAVDSGAGAVVIPLQEDLAGGQRKSLLLSLGIVVLVLLIASTNVAILMLARVSGRMRELSVRRALGAGTWRILSDVLLESLILGLLSGLIGVFIAFGSRPILLHFMPGRDAFKLIEINPAVLIFVAAISAVVGLGFGLLPALTVLRADIQHALRNGGNTTTIDARGRWLRHVFIVGEISLSIVLLFGTGLLLRSMISLQHQPLGFRTDHVIISSIRLPRTRYQNNEDVVKFFDRVIQQVRNIPGLQGAGLVHPLPIAGDYHWESFTFPGKSAALGEYEQASLEFIDAGYFPVMNIPLLEGRNLTDADDRQAEPVAIVNESFARKYWPGEDAVGKYVEVVRDPKVPRRVIGIVGNVRPTIDAPFVPAIYVSYKQVPFQGMEIVALPRGNAASISNEIGRVVQSVDPQMPAPGVNTIEAIVHDSLDPWRFALLLLGGLTGLAVLLIIVGLFAVISYLVRERTKELGVRMALGSSRAES